MKKKMQKLMLKAMLTVFAVSMVCCTVLTGMPQAAAAEVSAAAAVGGLERISNGEILLNTSGIVDPVRMENPSYGEGAYYMKPGSYVYYGSVYDHASDSYVPILWRVLDNDHDSTGAEGAMFLFSENVLTTTERFSASSDDDNIAYKYETEYDDTFIPLFWNGRFEHTYNGSYMATHQYPVRYFLSREHYWNYMTSSNPLSLGTNVYELSAIRPVTKDDSTEMIGDGFSKLDTQNDFTVTVAEGTITFAPMGTNEQTFQYTTDGAGAITLYRADGTTVVTNGRELSFFFDQNGNPAVMMHHVTGGATELWDVNVYQLTRKTGETGGFEGEYTAQQSNWITGNLHFYGRDKIINGENTSHDYFYLVGHAYTDPVNNPTLKNSYIFPLSVAELEKYVASYNCAPGMMATTLIGGNAAEWLLRTAYDNDLALSDRVGYVQKNGFVADTDADTAMGGRYGMNLEISDIAYTRRVGAHNVWSLGITEPAYQDTSDLFEASIDDVTVADGKYQVTINYKNAITSYTDYMIDHEHEYISAMILRDGQVVYYGHVAEVPKTEIGYNGIDPNTHSATFTLPGYETGDQLVVFWERETDDSRMTSFVSNMVYIDCIHMPGTSVATCVDYKTCIYCVDEEGYPTKFGHLDADNHAGEISWEKTDSTAAKWEHWQTCSACEATWDKGDCVVEADCTTVTTPCICGRSELDPDAHDFAANGICTRTSDHFEAPELVDGVYVIKNVGNLLWLSMQINDEGLTDHNVRLEVEDGVLSLVGLNFEPIGTDENPYTGTFDGAGVIITGIEADDDTNDALGFFGVTAGATIKNLVLANSTFTTNDVSGNTSVGAIAGVTDAATSIENSFAYLTDHLPLTGDGNATVTNSYYLAAEANETGGRTEAQFASGEIAYFLGEGWGQTLGIAPYPILGGETVYEFIDCQGIKAYSNNLQGKDVHNFDSVQEYLWNDIRTECDAILKCADCDATTTVACEVGISSSSLAHVTYVAEAPLSGGYAFDYATVIVNTIKDVTAVEVVHKTFDGYYVQPEDLLNNTRMTSSQYKAYFVPTGTATLITDGDFNSVELTPVQEYFGTAAMAAGTYDLVVIGRNEFADQAAIFEAVLIIDKVQLTLVIEPIHRLVDGTTEFDYQLSFAEDTVLDMDWIQPSFSDVPSAEAGSYELTVDVKYDRGYGEQIFDYDIFDYIRDENGDPITVYRNDDYISSVELTCPSTVTFRILQRTNVEIENKNWAEDYLVTEEYGNPIHEIRIPYGTPIPTPTADNFTVDEGSTLSFEWYRDTGEWVWDEELEDTIPVLKRLGQPPVNAGNYVLRVIGGATEDYVSSYLDIEFRITPLELGIELITDGYTYENNEYHDWYVVKNTQPLIPFKVTGLAPNDTLESAGIDTSVYLDDRYAYTYDTITALYPNALIYDYQLHAGTLRGVNGAENYESANRTIIIVRVFEEAPVPESATHSWDGTDKAVTIQVGHPAASHAGTEGVEYIYRATVTEETLGVVFAKSDYTDELFFSYDVTKEGVYTAVVEAHAGDENWVEVFRLEYTVSILNTLTGEPVESVRDVGRYKVTVAATEGDITNTAEVIVNRELRIFVKETSFNLTDSAEDIAYAIENHVFEAGYLPMLGHTIKDLDYTVDAEYGEITVSGWIIVDENGNDVSDLYSVDTIIYSWKHTIGGLNTVHVFDSPCDMDCNVRDCTVTRAPEPHVGGTATCVTRAICDVCGEFYGNPDEDNHVSDAKIHVPNQHDDGMHNLVHACCGQVIETAPHEVTVAATCTDKAICKVCNSEGTSFGELDPDNHTSLEYTYKSDGSYTHSVHHACCDAFIESRNHVGGDATCMTQAVCEHCDASYGPLDADDHEQPEGATYVTDGTAHLATYPCCGATVREEHSGGTATCRAQASCEHCGTAYGDLDPTNHASEEFTYALSPTSRARHTVSHSCCGVLVRTETHSGGEATCTEKAVCEHCGTAYGKKDPANHADEGFLYAVNKFDPTLHDKIHACCGEQAGSEAHSGGTAGCDAPAVCAGCGVHYGEMIEHTYDHACDYICNVCNEQTRAMVFATDEDEDGVCDTCGKVHEVVEAPAGDTSTVLSLPGKKEEEGEPSSDPEVA